MLDRLVSLIAPHECLGCHTEGLLLCLGCQAQATTIPERCYKCFALSPDCLTCAKCRRTSPLTSVQAATVYGGLTKDLIWKLKFHHARAAVEPMSRLMVGRLIFDQESVLVPVPTATSRVRQRGYDQAELLCRAISRQTKLPYRIVLQRHGQSRQVGTIKAERTAHLAKAFRAPSAQSVAGKHIVLVDDVLTTGATLESAARALKQAGAKRVDAIVFAQA
jgi:ComF family protein